uniref:RAP domain-containing protein n=1 Tax=Endozoicomonas acroporae TaxID=1701104 RepID=UPI0013D1B87B
ALLPHVKTKAESKKEKDHFKPQEVANLLWALAKLVVNGLELEKTAGSKEAVTALLSHVKTKAESAESKEEKDHFIPQHIANLMWALATLVGKGLEKTPKLEEAVAALLPSVQTNANSQEEKDDFTPQGFANLLWALAKLVDNGFKLEEMPKLKEAVVALLPHVKTKAESKKEKDHFNTQGIANLVWAVAKLADNGLELEMTPKLKKSLAALLPHVKTKAESKEEKDHFIPQHIANLLWAVAKLGEAIELSMVQSTFDSLVGKIGESSQLSQQDILMSLWGVMAICARFYLYYGNDNKNSLEKHIGELFSRLENTSPGNTEDQSIIAMAASWLGRPCPVAPNYQTIISQSQTNFRDQLQSSFPSLKIEEEKSLNSLPPVDLLLPDYNMVIDIQGPFHYVSGDFKTRNGSTLLKIALLQKLGFEVIEIPVNKLQKKDSIKTVIEQIKAKLAVLPKAHGSVSLNSYEWSADEAYFTADDGGQCSDDCYFTAEEYLEEQTKKPKKRKRKRKRKKPVKTAAC